ncbi:hypothetical protein Efla_005765 [Eimeria flavescens]
MICSSYLSRFHPPRLAGGLPIQWRFGAKPANFATSSGGRLLNPNPRPTQYQTVVVNEAINPPPGTPVNFTPYLIGLGAFMVLFPCIQTTMELNKYYRELSFSLCVLWMHTAAAAAICIVTVRTLDVLPGASSARGLLKTEHLYREGWSVHHYDKMKDEVLS